MMGIDATRSFRTRHPSGSWGIPVGERLGSNLEIPAFVRMTGWGGHDSRFSVEIYGVGVEAAAAGSITFTPPNRSFGCPGTV